MKHIVLACSIALHFLVFVRNAHAYELYTHGLISHRAFDGSARLQDYAEDVSIDTSTVFDPDDEAKASTEFSGFKNSGTARDWLAAGSVREDDYLQHLAGTLLRCAPAINPQSRDEQIDRPKQHFFDVQRDGGGIADGFPAPDWALGLMGRGPNADQNHFSLADARVHQLRSLTGETRTERDRYTAKMFRTLGHVIHVLQA